MKVYILKNQFILLLLFVINSCAKNNIYKIEYSDLDCVHNHECNFSIETKSKVLNFINSDISSEVKLTLSRAFINPLQLDLGDYRVSVLDKASKITNSFSMPIFDMLYYNENENILITQYKNLVNEPDELNIPISIFKDYTYLYSYPFCIGTSSTLPVFPLNDIKVNFLKSGLPNEITFLYSKEIKKEVKIQDSSIKVNSCINNSIAKYKESFPICDINTTQKILNNNRYWSVVCIDEKNKITGDFTTFIYNNSKNYSAFIKGRIINNVGVGNWLEFNEDGSIFEKLKFNDYLKDL